MKFISILLNFEKDYVEKYYHVLGHIIILENFRNNKYYLKILKLDMFVKFYDVLGHIIIIECFGQNFNFVNNIIVAIFKFNYFEVGSRIN